MEITSSSEDIAKCGTDHFSLPRMSMAYIVTFALMCSELLQLCNYVSTPINAKQASSAPYHPQIQSSQGINSLHCADL